MSNWYSPVPRGGLYKPHSASPLDSMRLRQSLAQNWKTNGQQGMRAEDATNALGNAQRQLLQVASKRTTSNSGMHPFKIYQFPRWQRLFQNDNDWQRFKVRYGYRGAILENGPGNSFNTFGTDSIDVDYDNFRSDSLGNWGQVPPSDGKLVDTVNQEWNEVIVPATGVIYYFWLSRATTNDPSFPESDVVYFGNDPANSNPPASLAVADVNSKFCFSMASGTFVVDPWPQDFPEGDPYHFIIGSVSWLGQYFSVSQMMHDNISDSSASLIGPSLGTRWRGVWGASAYYYQGDMVTEDLGDGAGALFRGLFVYTGDPSIGAQNNQEPFLNTTLPPGSPASGLWTLISYSPMQVNYHTDAIYQPLQQYLRTPN